MENNGKLIAKSSRYCRWLYSGTSVYTLIYEIQPITEGNNTFRTIDQHEQCVSMSIVDFAKNTRYIRLARHFPYCSRSRRRDVRRQGMNGRLNEGCETKVRCQYASLLEHLHDVNSSPAKQSSATLIIRASRLHRQFVINKPLIAYYTRREIPGNWLGRREIRTNPPRK